MASTGNSKPSWLEEETNNQDAPLLGSGEVTLQDKSPVDLEAEVGKPKSYGATDESKEETKEAVKETPWHVDKEEAKKPAKKGKKKQISISESLHEVLINRPHRPFCLVVFYVIQGVAICASLCLLITQILPLCIAPKKLGPLQLALRLYISLFCGVFVLVEFEVPLPFIKSSKLLQQFFTRGFLYSFLGLTGMEMSYSLRIDDLLAQDGGKYSISWVPLFMQISSWFMVITGCVYMVMGICCLKPLRKKLQDQYQQRMITFREQHIQKK